MAVCAECGQRRKCKKCVYAQQTRWRLRNKEHVREYKKKAAKTAAHIASQKRYSQSDRGRESARVSSAKMRVVHKTAVDARNFVNWQIRVGNFKRNDLCEKCGARENIEAHHEDYLRPLDVIWWCRSCHKRHHANERDLQRKEKGEHHDL